jgi:hypothetical protein
VALFLLLLLALFAASALGIGISDGTTEYRREIGTYVFGPRPVVLHQVFRGVPGCASGKWDCLRDGATGAITMRHAAE